MSYEVLITIVVINAFVTLALWRQVSRKANRPFGLNKKAAKALWRSDPIVPRHNPPKVAGGNWSGQARDVDRLFFADFTQFADVVNWWLADEFTKSRFRLQDLPEGDVLLNVDFDSGPRLGRCFALYYNQTDIGRLEIDPSYYYTTENPNVYTSVKIEWPRFLSSHELIKILGAIAMHVTSNNPKSVESLAAGQSIHYALTETLWREYRISQYDRPDDAEDWGELNVSFHGVAEFYMQRKNAPAFRDEAAGVSS